jgi:hypothetical protein
MKTLEQEWSKFKETALKKAHADDQETARKFFYFGMLAITTLEIEIAKERMTEEKEFEIYNGWQRELKGFIKELIKSNDRLN